MVLFAVVWVAGLFILSAVDVRACGPVGSLPDGYVGVLYSLSPIVGNITTGSTVTVTTQQPLPAGMSIDNQGMLGGVPLEIYGGAINVHVACEGQGDQEYGIFLNIYPAPVVVSTGKYTANVGKITAVGTNYMIVDKVMIRLTAKTIILKAKKNSTMTVGQYAAYAGVINTDRSVTASLVLVGR